MNLCVQSGGFVPHFSFEEGYRKIAEAGFSSVDFNIDTAFNAGYLKTHMNQGACIYEKSLEEIIGFWKPQYDAIRAAGLYVYQAHAPFPAYDKNNPAFTDYCIETYRKCILYCQHIGCKRLVIHGVSLTRDDQAHTQADIDAVNEKLYTSLIGTLKETDVVVCLENLFSGYDKQIRQGTCSDWTDAIAQIDHYNELAGKECFGICVDTGHLNLLGLDQYKYIVKLGKRIKAFHVHDNDGLWDLHLAPYTGTIDWNSFCRAVKEIGYDGDLSFETFRQYTGSRVPDKEVAELYLKLVADIGRVFRKKIG